MAAAVPGHPGRARPDHRLVPRNEDWWTGAREQSEKVYERLGR